MTDAEGEIAVEDPIGGAYFTDSFGPHNVPIRLTVENDTDYDRTEVVGAMVPFPDTDDGVFPAGITDCHMYLEGGRETIGFGWGSYPYTLATEYTLTLPWTGPLNAITAGSGNILPGSCEITLYYYFVYPNANNYGKITFTDSQVTATTGRWDHPAIESSSINYTTGAINIRFNQQYSPEGSKPIRMTYKFANPVNYPTQWTVLRTWPSGRVRQAKAWFGQASGVGVFIPKKLQSITTVPAYTITREYTRGYFRVGTNPSVNVNLPTYAMHSEMAAALNSGTGQLMSQIFDSNGNAYYANLLSTATPYEENVVEDPANSGGRGWMKVIQRRSYHTSTPGDTFSSLPRDFLSCTSYLYVPHSSRNLEVETRLGNDYAGADPLEHTFTENFSATGNGATRNFSIASLTNVFQTTGGYADIRRGRVKIYAGSTLVAKDYYGDGNLIEQNGSGVTGTINYSTGAVSISYASSALPPAQGVVLSCQYKSYYVKIGTASGVQTVNTTLPYKPSQYSIHVAVVTGSTTQYEGWDGGGSYNSATGQIVPYSYTTVQPTQLQAASLTTTVTGSIQTNVVPGTAGFFVGATAAGADSVVFCRDNGTGTLSGKGVITGTLDYVTGAYSITFTATPNASHNLYATYGRTTVARPISGSINYSTRALSVTTSQSVPASTGIFVSYIRNKLSSFNHDPNVHPLGSVGLNKWLMLFSATRFTDMECEARRTYLTTLGSNGTTRWANILAGPNQPSPINPGGPSTWLHEHLHDGASVTRIFFLYCGSGATTAENNTWAAKKIHVLTPIPTLDAYSSTRAMGMLEGAMTYVTPEQISSPFESTARNFSEDIARVTSNLTDSGDRYLNKSDHFSAVTRWNGGMPSNQLQGRVFGARSSMGWYENWDTGTNSGGAARVGMDWSPFYMYSQAWQAVRYLYHASTYYPNRPGQMLWNAAMCWSWGDRAFYNYIPTSPSSGMIPGATAAGGNYTIRTQEFLNRGWKYGWSVGTISVTNGSTRIEFSESAGDPSDPEYNPVLVAWGSNNPNYGSGGNFNTLVNGSLLPGRRRISIQGSIRSYLVTDIVYDSVAAKWVGTLDANYAGPTSSSTYFGLFSDPVGGQDIVNQRNDPRLFHTARIGCGQFAFQHGIEGDSASHQAADVVFDTWNVTGSWMLWDIFRHRAEWNMGSVKDMFDRHFYADQMRTNAWTFRSIITAYSGIKYLVDQPGFGFLTDVDYGSARDRYASWLRGRWSQWHDYGARGEMDPNGTVAVNGKERIKDIRVSSGSDKADWYSMSFIGNPNPVRGGAGSWNPATSRYEGRTEAQVKFDEVGYDYVSVWEIGYLTPWVTATWREFRQDQTVMQLPNRGTTATFSEIMTKLFNGYAAFMTDYAFITRRQITPNRNFPGLVNCTRQVGWDYNISDAVGTPINFVNNNNVRPTYDTIVWPQQNGQYDINWVADQVYWLRGAGRSFADLGRDHIDRLGWPLIGPGGQSKGTTTFEDGWHFPGVPFDGNPYFEEPGWANSDPNGFWPCLRAPQKAESFNMVGASFRNTEGLTFVCATFLMHVARFHSNAVRRSIAGDILNRVLWQGKAMSLITGIYDIVQNEFSQGRPVEWNTYTGPITGDFPYSTETNNQPIDRWWDVNYLSRRRLTSTANHDNYLMGRDVFVVDLTAYGIPAKTFQSGAVDIRVVRQGIDGTNIECQSVVRRNPSGNYKLYVSTPVDIPSGQALQTGSSYAWYIYYGNVSAGSAVWFNPESIDGPFANDSQTAALWNQNGNYSTDAGPYNWPLSTVSMFEPDYVDGPFGGAIGVVRANSDVVFSSGAIALAKTGSSWLNSQFTFEFYFKVDARKLEPDRTLNYGLFAINEDTIFPLTCHIENSSRQIKFSASTGGTAGYTVTTVTGYGQGTRVIIGTGNSSQTVFTYNVGAGVAPGSVSVTASMTSSTVYGTDDGLGVISGTGIASGTIDYVTGDVSITTTPTLGTGVNLALYLRRAGGNTNGWGMDRWNHVAVSYNGQRLRIVVNGYLVGTVAASGSLQPIPAGSVTRFSVGSIYAPAAQFTARSDIQIAEFRVSTAERAIPRKAVVPLVVTPAGEETQIVTREEESPDIVALVAPVVRVNQSVNAYVAIGDILQYQPVESLILLSQNNEVDASVDMMLGGHSITEFSPSVEAYVSYNTTQQAMRATVAAVVAGVVEMEEENQASVEAFIVLHGQVDQSVEATVQIGRYLRADCSAYVAVTHETSIDEWEVHASVIVTDEYETQQSVVASIAAAYEEDSPDIELTVAGMKDIGVRTVADIARQRTRTASVFATVVVVDKNEDSPDLEALVADVYQITNDTAAQVALSGAIRNQVDLYLTPPERGRMVTQSVDATVRVDDNLVESPDLEATVCVVTPIAQDTQATVVVPRQIEIPVAAILQANDINQWLPVEAEIWLASTAQASVEATVGSASVLVNQPVALSVVGDPTTIQLPVEARIRAADMTVNVEVQAGIIDFNHVAASPNIEAEVSIQHTATQVCEVDFMELWARNLASCNAFVAAGSMQLTESIEAIIAFRATSSAGVEATMCNPTTISAVCRAFVVIGLSQNLTATGVNTISASKLEG